MKLCERIKLDLNDALKNKETETISALRVIIGEIQRQEAKDVNDEKVLGILRKFQKGEKSVMEQTNQTASSFLEVLEKYLPTLMSKEEIETYINENIDLTNYKNPMQAMRDIMPNLKGKVNGNDVKEVLMNISKKG